MKTNRDKTRVYTTKDGSEIREILHPNLQSGLTNQSLAEATVHPGEITTAHFHKKTEEIYYILSGNGLMYLNEDSFTVEQGDSILIPPEHIHYIKNTGNTKLVFLCCCSPAYQHNDTFLTGE